MSTISASTTSTTAYKVTADTTGTLVLQTGSTPTTAVTIDTAQNVGLGVTPSAWGSGWKALQVTTGLALYTNAGDRAAIANNAYYNGSAWTYATTGYASRYEQANGAHTWYNAPSGTAGNAITFNQVMTLSPLGSFAALGLGATPASIGGDLDIIANQNGIGIGYSTSVYRRMVIQSSNVMAFISGSNTATLTAAGVWTNASDAKLKKNITDIKYGLSTVLATQPRSFERNDVDGEFIGFIAQELKEQIPEVVFGSEDEQYTVDYGSLAAVAFKAIQEQQTIITQLTARIEALEAK